APGGVPPGGPAGGERGGGGGRRSAGPAAPDGPDPPARRRGKEAAMYDVIVVGARVAGSSTAMLLARSGLKVLAVDRAEFPSDTLSTHQVQVPGVARLARWGLLDRVAASGAPARRHLGFSHP